MLSLAVVLWLVSGVEPSEVARYLGYELGFVATPGILVGSLVLGRGWCLRTIVLGWGLGYLLEVIGYTLCAAANIRSWFLFYPALIGIPALLAHARRRTRSDRPTNYAPAPGIRPVALICAPCVGLLLWTAGSYFSQFPLPRSVGAATYQEDTPFTISLAGEVLHHWPATLPQVAGQPLHYHLAVYLHLAAISDVTGIDLSVVVMRLYLVPLLLLLVLMIVLVGRDLRGRLSVGVVAAALTVLVRSTPTHGAFSFYDFSYLWLTESHSQLLGLVFFVGALLLSSELLGARSPSRGTLVRNGTLLGAYLSGCAISKEYATLPPLALGALLFTIAIYIRRREVSWRALSLFTGASAALLLAVRLQLHAGGGGFGLQPLAFVRSTPVAHALAGTLGLPFGIALATAVVTLALLGPATVAGLVLFGVLRRHGLTHRHRWLLAVFASGAVPLFLLEQPGLGQLQMFMSASVAGSVLAADGLVAGANVLRRSIGRRALAGVALAGVGGALFLFGSLALTSSPLPTSIGSTRILAGVALVVLALTALSHRPAPGWRAALIGVAAVGLLTASDYLWVARLVVRKLRSTIVFDPSFPRVPTAAGALFEAMGAAGLCLAVVGLWRAFGGDRGRFPLRSVAHTTVVVAAVASGAVAVPLSWAPQPVLREASGLPPYSQADEGITRGLYDGLTWLRRNTPADTVVAVNNFSLQPHDNAKDFVYSAFSQRRVVLEGWDYTPQTAQTGKLSLPLSRTPFPGRAVAECAAIEFGDPRAITFLHDRYGADYLFADLVHGWASTLLGRHATLVFRNPDAAIYRIPARTSRALSGTPRFVTTRTEAVACLGLPRGEYAGRGAILPTETVTGLPAQRTVR